VCWRATALLLYHYFMRVPLSFLKSAALLATALLMVSCEKAPTAPTVPPGSVAAVTITPAADTVAVGEFAQFSATVLDTLGNPVSTSVSWQSSDPQVFTVSSTGRVKGVSEGSALLRAAVGAVRDSALVTVVPATGGWVRQTSSTTVNLNGVFFLPDGRNGWVAGDGGTILRTIDGGATWTRPTTGTTFNLNAVWFTSSSDGWAVGAGGTVLVTHNGGSSWTRLSNVGQSEELLDVQFATSVLGWAVGANGLILRTTDQGANWESFRVPTVSNLESVSFTGSNDGWAVGDGGLIVGTHDAGAIWYVLPSITVQPLRAVYRRSEAKAWAVGSSGVAPRTFAGPDSTEWELENAGASHQMEGVQFTSDLTGFAVGFDVGGMILRTDDGGLNWAAQVSNTASRLNDVYFVDSLRGWAVGQSGTIVHTGGGGIP